MIYRKPINLRARHRRRATYPARARASRRAGDHGRQSGHSSALSAMHERAQRSDLVSAQIPFRELHRFREGSAVDHADGQQTACPLPARRGCGAQKPGAAFGWPG
ncbi:hypothetical protein ACU4GR_01780 [Methylobacterium oryzae CBMB20]